MCSDGDGDGDDDDDDDDDSDDSDDYYYHYNISLLIKMMIAHLKITLQPSSSARSRTHVCRQSERKGFR